ncbi:SDR family oxidoreductase [Rhodobacterales bacterium HKCCE2091]|nr:SDR family oxidoreductase [Rhodobacterales bacterium HKCCE2091]
MTSGLDGATAIVTGGSRGIGRAIAEALAAEGAKVAITAASDIASARDTAHTLTQAGGDVRAYSINLADRGSVERGLSAVVADLGCPTVVVNNAGASAKGFLLDLSTEDWDRLFAVHARGFFHLATSAARHMIAEGLGGAIVGIAGASALRCYPGSGSYAPSKAAVLSAARQMAVEWAPHGIRVNCVCPGPVRDPSSNWQEREPALAEEVLGLPIQRAASPQEIADAVLYLARAEYVTGQALPVDGGGTTTWYIRGRRDGPWPPKPVKPADSPQKAAGSLGSSGTDD